MKQRAPGSRMLPRRHSLGPAVVCGEPMQPSLIPVIRRDNAPARLFLQPNIDQLPRWDVDEADAQAKATLSISTDRVPASCQPARASMATQQVTTHAVVLPTATLPAVRLSGGSGRVP